ncbi:hypothetical protein PCASD_08738 [Puccinia coronata f. sp. avenae]|uniref:Crossover junction endonuclease MUS81 n=1 Tax=Puccinia coronata f. sp. avenae TaxID=200324 RepID=A0A2N5TE82_9BASI|nr:hypothetical protein PCASD_08738 [Puccinia coronata f. sp. avenae]
MPPCKEYPNAEWAGWIQDVANQATHNNAKVSQTYSKAAKAIRNYPIKLNHPKDALSLPGVGPKIVKILSDHLETWCQTNQVMFPPQVPVGINVSVSGESSDDASGLTSADADLSHEEDRHSSSKGQSTIQKFASRNDLQTNASKTRSKKPYHPKPRDAAWGILAAMYTVCELTDLKKFSSREMITDRAARYSDRLYIDIREDTNNRYGYHWQSGIKALIKHGLVITHATLRPARYALTRTGFDIATVIAAHEEIPILDVNLEDTLYHEEDPPRAQSRYPDPRKEDPSSSISRDLIPHESNAPVEVKYSAVHLDDKSLRDNLESSENVNCLDTAPEAPLPFRFYYVNNVNRRVLQSSEAATRLNSKSKQSYCKIEYHCTQQLHQFRRNHVLVDEKESCLTLSRQETMIGWLKSDKSMPTCPGFLPAGAPRKHSLTKTDRATTINFLLMSEDSASKPTTSIYRPPEILHAAAEYAITTGSSTRPDPCPAERHPHAPTPKISSTPSERVQLHSCEAQPKQAQLKSKPKPSGSRPRASFATADHVPRDVPKPRASIGTVESIAHQVKAEVWKAGTYSVMLLIDNREVQSQNNRDGIFHACLSRARQTMGHQVKVQQRPLAVGDVIWVAVHDKTGKEVVLDSVVERKRLDDLCKSIVDARFHEQKARLKNSGLKDRIYLVESYYSHNNRDLYEQQIQTSQVEIMLLDDCQLQSTADWQESVEYLVMRTNVLSQIHQTIDLSVIPDKHIDRNSYLSFINELRRIHPDEYWVTSYNVYESLNGKSANLTVQELWGRMIHQVSGMSVEKVGEFVTRWPTPRSFTEEFYQQYRVQSAVSLGHVAASQDSLSKWIEEQFCRDTGHQRKKLGPAVSKKISDLFSLNSY